MYNDSITKVNVVSGVRFVDEGNIMPSGGIACGIELSLHIIKKLLGKRQQKPPPAGWNMKPHLKAGTAIEALTS